MYLFLGIIIFLFLFTLYVLNLPVFGRLPQGDRLEKIKNQPYYSDGEIKNRSYTPAKAEDVSYLTIIIRAIKGNKNAAPPKPLPHQTPNLERSEKLKLTWFGHSSYLIQVDQLNILVDPVFSKRTSPFQFLGTKGFEGTDFIKPDQLPPLDIILLTHDHYDHLDYISINQLKDKTKLFITSLGVGSHLESWGIKSDLIKELSWDESLSPLADLSFTAKTARHFSGRQFKRNQTLWSSFILQTKHNKIYLGGDSGYDIHFKTIGETDGPFDLAILECGQYNKMWPAIHMFPEEVAQAAADLNAKFLLPVHWGKFRLAIHDWDELIKEVVKYTAQKQVNIITPQLGETFILDENQPNSQWWLNL